jgi:hypothetical protein
MRSSKIPGYNPPSNYTSSKKVDVSQITNDFKKYEDPTSKKIKDGKF